MASRIIFGFWGFQQAAVISLICFTTAVYLYARSIGRLGIPDGALMLDRAQRLVSSGKVSKAISILSRTIRLDPNLWQAYEYRGKLRVTKGQYLEALEDLSEAIRLAPHERHLYLLRAQLYDDMGQTIQAQRDYEAAARLDNT